MVLCCFSNVYAVIDEKDIPQLYPFTGMVVTCASCADIYPWAAFVFGVIGGFTYIAWNRFMLWIKVDDPLDAVAGVLFTYKFSKKCFFFIE